MVPALPRRRAARPWRWRWSRIYIGDARPREPPPAVAEEEENSSGEEEELDLDLADCSKNCLRTGQQECLSLAVTPFYIRHERLTICRFAGFDSCSYFRCNLARVHKYA